MQSVSGCSLLVAVLAVGCGGSSLRRDSGDGTGGGGARSSPSGGTSNPSGGSAGTPSCQPQDALFVGYCQPGPKYVYTGVECIGMSGCSCLGEDCDELVPLPPADPSNPTSNPCVVEFGGCFGISRTCDEIRAVYAAYTSHIACEHDDECRVNPGGCAVGLGGCYHVMNVRWPPSGLEALVDAWRAAGCTGAVCDCAASPASVACVNGECTGVP